MNRNFFVYCHLKLTPCSLVEVYLRFERPYCFRIPLNLRFLRLADCTASRYRMTQVFRKHSRYSLRSQVVIFVCHETFKNKTVLGFVGVGVLTCIQLQWEEYSQVHLVTYTSVG